MVNSLPEKTQQSYPLTVVIPTLGGGALAETIAQLNHGTLRPSEVLVCIPEEDAFRVENLSFPNVRIIKTEIRGQVAQRAIGFQQAGEPMVLQLDDDIFLVEDALQILVNSLIMLGHGNAVAPVYYDAATGRCIHEIDNGWSGWIRSLYYSIICGAPWGSGRMGVVTESGFNFGVDDSRCSSEPFETQWVPGGCALSFKEDVIEEDFFPFSGKAYGEDVIHSYLRTQMNIRHWVIPGARCLIDAPEQVRMHASIKAQENARRHFVRLVGGEEWRLHLYSILTKIRNFLFGNQP